MKYDRELLDFYYHSVLNGYSPFVFEDSVFLARHLSSKDFFEVHCHLLKYKEWLHCNGILPEYDLLKRAGELGLWTPEDDAEIKRLEAQIESKSSLIPKLQLPSQVTQVKNEIKAISSSLQKKEGQKFEHVGNSLESKLQNERRDYFVYLCLCNQRYEKIWPTFEDFLAEDSDRSIELVSIFYKTVGFIGSSLVRAIARDTDARMRLKDFALEPRISSSLLLELKQWCDFYISVYDLEDKPDDSILLDDDKLDGWLIARRQKYSNKSVNSSDGFVGIVASKEDMSLMGGSVEGNVAIKLAQKVENG